MQSFVRAVASPLVALVLFAATVGATPAGAFLAPSKPSVVAAGAGLTPVEGRRGWGRGGRWFGPGPGIAILGGVIIGGAIVAAAVAERRADGHDMRRCADEFRSFDPHSGTYVDRNGEVRVCPYLF